MLILALKRRERKEKKVPDQRPKERKRRKFPIKDQKKAKGKKNFQSKIRRKQRHEKGKLIPSDGSAASRRCLNWEGLDSRRWKVDY